jgi:Zn-dependent protease
MHDAGARATASRWLAPVGSSIIRVHVAWLIGAPLAGLALFALVSADTVARLVVALVPLAWLLSLLLHEAAHALAGHRFGARVLFIAAMPAFGVTAFDRTIRPGKEELLVFGAGPAMNLLLAACAAVPGLLAHGIIGEVARSLALFNVLLCALNLLPALPCDGGRVARACVWLHTRNQPRATVLVGRLGVASGYALGVFAGVALAVSVLGLFNALIIGTAIGWYGGIVLRATVRYVNDAQDSRLPA